MVAAVALLGAQAYAANAATSPAPSAGVSAPRPTQSAQTAGPARLSDPGKVLPAGWQHSSDEAVTVAGDATGLHVLAASEGSGYAWKTVATLGDPSVQTDLWIGQACVTASGRYAVAVYAPEQVANMAEAQGVLGRAAVVNLKTGAVKDLGGGFSVAYFDPGCGTGDTAALTRGGWANDHSTAAMSTTLVLADAAAGRVSAAVKVPGQVTSAVPYGGQIAAADGARLEQVSVSGKRRLLAMTAAVPFRLAPGADGSLGYQTVAGQRVDLWDLAGGHARKVASATAGSVELRQAGGRVWLVGPQASKVAGLPRQWQPVDAPAVAQPSTLGTLAVTSAGSAAPAEGQRYARGSAQAVAISAELLTAKGGTASFKVPAGAAPTEFPAAAGRSASRTAAGPATAQTAGSPATPVSDDRTCAIALNDPHVQAYQPTFKQVEWAADQAVQGTLTNTRPAGLYGSSLPSYTPQGLFPLPNGNGALPAQVLLGVLTAESNLQQASQHVIQGQTSNPLSSFNWYGNWVNGETTNTGLVNWQNSDCGYGIGQITSGMCLAQGRNGNQQCEYQPPMSAEDQLAVAVDYQANIAKAAQLLTQEWNTLWADGIRPTGPVPAGDAPTAYIGEWYMAVWAYNSGLEPGSSQYGNTTGCQPGPSCTDNGGAGGNWGLGYADNPVNPAYPPDRPVFPGTSSAPTPEGGTYTTNWDMSHPQYWPYQEKVIAWAFDSITLWDYSQGKDVQAFAYAHGNTMVPPYDTFCVQALNDCDPSAINSAQATAPDSCQLPNDHCWWHEPASWITTTASVSCQNCGYGVNTYPAGAPDPGPEPIAAKFAQTCNSNWPSNAVFVGDGGASALGCPGSNWTSQGSFTWDFAPDANGNYSSKMAFDQIGAGFGGHFWFGYSQPSDQPSATVITGTWNPPASVSGWTDIRVAIPSYGANADGANYQIDPGGGKPGWDIPVNQGATAGSNAWVDLGTFDLGSGAKVSLSNVTPDVINGVGDVAGSDIAWSAAVFLPAAAPRYAYTAMGDSYSSGEGNPPYDVGTAGGCDRSPEAFGRQLTASTSGIGDAGIQHIACSGATIANLTTTGQNGEQPQISQMYPGATLVSVTIGGNDAGFAQVLTYCLTNKTTCESNYNSSDGNNLYTKIDNLQLSLEDAYRAMQHAAPSATVVAVTYPDIFQPGTTCPGVGNLPVPDIQFLISLTLYLDNTIVNAARAAGINVLDERYAFTGHQLCSPAPWVIGLPDGFQSGTSVLDSSAWFHPNAKGHAQIAADMGVTWPTIPPRPGPVVWPQTVNSDPAYWLPSYLPHGLPSTAQAQAMLAALPRNVPAPPAGSYVSTAPYWGWTTRDFGSLLGCSTRNMVLQEQAIPAGQPALAVGNGCNVVSGNWELPYDVISGAETQPVTASYSGQPPSGLPIDHVVARSNAWAQGAWNWPDEYPQPITVTTASGSQSTTMGQQMLADFANDMSGPELLVVSGNSNSQKQDFTPDQWMPANKGMTCAYVKMWVTVKWDWHLGVSPAELAFDQNALSSSC